jgi:hypothetical protein
MKAVQFSRFGGPEVPLADVAEAQRVSEHGHGRGKLVLLPGWDSG